MNSVNESQIEKRRLYIIQNNHKQKNSDDDPYHYTYKHPLLVKYWFYWTFLVFLIDNYYINQCFFWPTFQSVYNYAITHLIPLNVIFLLIYALNIIFKIMMSPLYQNNPVLSPRKNRNLKIWHYFTYQNNGLLIIVYIIFVISFLIPYQGAQIIHLVIILRLLQMNAFLNVFYYKIYTYNFVRVVYTLTIIFYVLLYLSHILGCLFYIIDQKLIELQYFGDPNEYPDHYYQYSSQSFTPIQSLYELDRYIYAYYFSSGLVSTIAYGDVVGKNWVQDAYTMVLLVLSTITVAFLLEEFMIIMGDYKFQIFQVIHRFKSLKELMMQKNIPLNLQMKVRNSLLYSQYYDKFHNPSQVFDKLSQRLKNDIYYSGYNHLFKQIFEPLGITNIRDICNCIEQVIYQPQTHIYYPDWKILAKYDYQQHQNDMIQEQILKPKLIILIKGKLLQYTQWQSSSKQFKIRQNNNTYNVFQFLTNTRVRFGLRSKSVVRAICISQQNFYNLLDEDDDIKKKLRQQRQMILSNSTARNIFYDKCQLCDQNDHNIIHCPDIHFVIDNNIERAYHFQQIMSSRANHRKSSFKRKEIKSNKVIGLTSYLNIFQNILSPSFLIEQKNDLQLQQLPFLFLKTSIRSMLGTINYKEEDQDNQQLDCNYDPSGINQKWSLE